MREIKSHTALRGIAALLVSYFHIDITVSENAKARNYTMLIENSYALVDLFFVLSGFIMAYVYWEKFISSINRKECADFFIARFSRIYPLHLATFILMVLLSIYSNGFSVLTYRLGDIIQNIFLIQAWGLTDQFFFNFPSWSVSVEFFAYLLFPLIMILIRLKYGALCLAIIAFSAYLFMLLILGTFHVEENLSLIRGIPSFILGILTFRIRAITSFLSDSLISILQISCSLTIILLMHFDTGLFIALTLFPILVLSLWEDRGILAKALSIRPLVYLGALSYSIYLLHVPIRNCMYHIFPKLDLELSHTKEDVLFIVGTLGITLICSALTFHLFEKPSRDGIKKIFYKVRQPSHKAKAAAGVEPTTPIH